MSMRERTGKRPSLFSTAHRSLPNAWGMVDGDWFLYCRDCDQPHAIVEEALDNGQARKPAHVGYHVARKADLPFYIVLTSGSAPAIDLRVKEVHPLPDPQWRTISWSDWCRWEQSLRDRHECEGPDDWTAVGRDIAR